MTGGNRDNGVYAGGQMGMGEILVATGGALCVAGAAGLVLAVAFFGKQRAKLIDRINGEYKCEEIF